MMNLQTKTFYVIRSGWNAANQSSTGRKRNPANSFESGRFELVAIVEADSDSEAVTKTDNVTVYNNQTLFATANPRSEKGLTAAIA